MWVCICAASKGCQAFTRGLRRRQPSVASAPTPALVCGAPNGVPETPYPFPLLLAVYLTSPCAVPEQARVCGHLQVAQLRRSASLQPPEVRLRV